MCFHELCLNINVESIDKNNCAKHLQIGLFFPRRFLDMEIQRKVMVLQQRVKELENENSVLRQRLSDAISGKVIKI